MELRGLLIYFMQKFQLLCKLFFYRTHSFAEFIKKKSIFIMLIIVPILHSCSSGKMFTSSVGYQSIRTTFEHPDLSTHKIPDDTEIILEYSITKDGCLGVVVSNNTNNIMLIDQTMSFFINNGNSTSYFDPTVKTETVTDLLSETNGTSINAGVIGDALGVGGIAGSILDGINLGASTTDGTSTQNTTIIADQPKVSIGPKGSCAMSKMFQIGGAGRNALKHAGTTTIYTPQDSYCKFSVCISYSLDRGNSFKTITTDFYANSKIVLPVKRKGMVNETLRNLFAKKTDALNENLWLLYFNTNVPNAHDSMVKGFLYDYQ